MAVIFAQGGSTEKRLAEQLDLAEGYQSEPDYENAIVAYEAAIEIDPGCRDAYLGLAQTDSSAILKKPEEVEEESSEDRMNCIF